jgi:hypothetical protein
MVGMIFPKNPMALTFSIELVDPVALIDLIKPIKLVKVIGPIN